MPKLREFTTYLDDQEAFVGVSASWGVKGAIDGIEASGGQTTSVGTKAITDVAEAMIAAIIAEGPQVPA